MLLSINQPLYSTGPFSSPMKFSDLTVMTGKAGKKTQLHSCQLSCSSSRVRYRCTIARDYGTQGPYSPPVL